MTPAFRPARPLAASFHRPISPKRPWMIDLRDRFSSAPHRLPDPYEEESIAAVRSRVEAAIEQYRDQGTNPAVLALSPNSPYAVSLLSQLSDLAGATAAIAIRPHVASVRLFVLPLPLALRLLRPLARIIQSPRRKPPAQVHTVRLPQSSGLDRPRGHTAPLPPCRELQQRAVQLVSRRSWRRESEGHLASVRTHDDTNPGVASSKTAGLRSAASGRPLPPPP